MTEIYPWFESTLEHTADLLTSERMPHGLLVDLPRGWGTERLLSHLTRQILDAASPLDAQTAHPDLKWTLPEDVEIKVDEIRAIVDWATRKPVSAARKVVVVQDAHRMNVAAANSLLKTLEEPPPSTYVILESGSAARLLPTLRSRCQRLPYDAQAAQRWTADQPELSPFLTESGGAPVTALEMAQENASHLKEDLLKLGAPKSREAALKDVLSTDLVAWLARWYRLLPQLAAAQDSSKRRELLNFAEELAEIRRQIDSSKSANDRLLLERLLHRWAGLEIEV